MAKKGAVVVVLWWRGGPVVALVGTNTADNQSIIRSDRGKAGRAEARRTFARIGECRVPAEAISLRVP